MACLTDVATAYEERDREMATQRRAPPGPVDRGQCLYCGEPMPPGRRWCDAGHRDAWQRLKERH